MRMLTLGLQSRPLNLRCNVPRLSAQSMDATCTLSPTSTVCLIFFSKARTLHSRSVRTRVPVGGSLVLCNLTVTKLASLLMTCKHVGVINRYSLQQQQQGACKMVSVVMQTRDASNRLCAHTRTHTCVIFEGVHLPCRVSFHYTREAARSAPVTAPTWPAEQVLSAAMLC